MVKFLRIFLILSLFPRLLFAEEVATPPSRPNFFAENFYLTPSKNAAKTYQIKDLVFVESPDPKRKTQYAIVTDFGPNALKTRSIPGLLSAQDVQKWVSDNLKTAEFQGVEIKKLLLPSGDGTPQPFYWVGHKAYPSLEEAQADIALAQTIAESQGQDFKTMVTEAQTAYQTMPEAPEILEIKTPAQYQKEEELVLKFMDQLDIGNELFGPFQGSAQGEPIVWQSFGETTFRATNLSRKRFNAQVGFWTNRVVFKGIRAPWSTIDPYLELTPSLESNGIDFASHIDLAAGVEWRPFGANPWFYNFRPASLPLLIWVRNFRFFLQYMDRKNIKQEIENSRDYDFRAGVQIFYEWGLDLPSVDEGPPTNVPEFLRTYIWGEYFGDYHYEKTNFSTEKVFNAFIWNSSIILGIKLPGIPLPPNPINDKIILMPYMRFEHVNNTDFSFPFQNRFFVAAGVRWMPFNNYRFKENEWLSRTKLFMEYVGIGDVQFTKQDGEVPEAVVHDLRFGINLSYKRF